MATVSEMRWIIELDGSKRLQYRSFHNGKSYWEDVPKVQAEFEYKLDDET